MVIFFLTSNEESIPVFLAINMAHVLALFLIWISIRFLDAFAMHALIRGTEGQMSFYRTFQAVALRIFFNMITPFSFGGQPFVIAALHKRGIETGKGTMIVFLKSIFASVYNMLFGLIAFIYLYSRLDGQPVIKQICATSGLIMLTLIILFFVLLFNARLMHRILCTGCKILNKVKLVKNASETRKKIIGEYRNAVKSLKTLWNKNPINLITAFLTEGVYYAMQMFLLWYILSSLDVPISFADGMIMAGMLFFVINFLPTPGSAGLGEILFSVMFVGFVPIYALGIAIFVWRFFHQYLSAAMGALFSLRTL
jgi:uncharacterized protein (TIRG00374 family)